MKTIQIKSVKKISNESRKYDIEVAGTNNFFANGILVHNCTIYHNGESHARSIDSGNHPSRDYVKSKAREIASMGFPEGWRLMGENLYAKHSIEYDNIPDFFILFGVADENNVARSWDEVEEWAELLDIPHVPVLWRGIWDTKKVMSLYPFKSNMNTKGEGEGYVVRDAGSFPMVDFSKHAAKFVREKHVQPEADHWMNQAVIPNKRAGKPPKLTELFRFSK